MSLLTVGTIAFDEVETPFGKSEKILGGAATYIALSASKMGTQTDIISVVGEDFPQEYSDILKENQCDIQGVEVVKGGKTFFWSGKYHMDMNTRDTLKTELNVLETFSPKIPEAYQDTEVLMLGNLHPSVQLEVVEKLVNRPPMVIMDTMNYWMENTWEQLLKIIKKVDVLTINDEEARQLSGEYSLRKAADVILKMGPKSLIIKKGEHGALLFNNNEVFFAPALPLEEVYDPTGAGDTFAGGFSGYLAKTKDYSFGNMKRAVIYGSALASFTVEAFGVERLLKVTRAEIAERIKALKKLSYFEIL